MTLVQIADGIGTPVDTHNMNNLEKLNIGGGSAYAQPIASQDILATLNFLNKKAGLPLGFLFAWPFPTPPDGAIQCNGAQYNRTLYADFYAYISSKGWVKTEAEWQSIASANGGYCPWYSDGDGSTTFRTPKFAPFMQTAIASDNVGKYHAAGLPNIVGGGTTEQSVGGWSGSSANISQGALRTTAINRGPRSQSSYRDGYFHMISLDASKANSIYGSSSTVQPESHEWMICVVVAGQATNIGSTDVSNVMSAVAQVQAELPNKLSSTTPHITDVWKSGSEWYRVWSDGFIEQGGHYDSGRTVEGSFTTTISLPKQMTTTDYVVQGTAKRESRVDSFSNFDYDKKTKTSFVWVGINGLKCDWYVCGY